MRCDFEKFPRCARPSLLESIRTMGHIFKHFPRCARSSLKEFLSNWGILYGGDINENGNLNEMSGGNLGEKIDVQSVKSRDRWYLKHNLWGRSWWKDRFLNCKITWPLIHNGFVGLRDTQATFYWYWKLSWQLCVLRLGNNGISTRHGYEKLRPL